MKKFSVEWKYAKNHWTQKHQDDMWGTIWKIHYIQYDTEYSVGHYRTKAEAELAMAGKFLENALQEA